MSALQLSVFAGFLGFVLAGVLIVYLAELTKHRPRDRGKRR